MFILTITGEDNKSSRQFDLCVENCEVDVIQRSITASIQWKKPGDNSSVLSLLDSEDSSGYVFPLKATINLSSIKSKSDLKVEKNIKLKVTPDNFSLSREFQKLADGYIKYYYIYILLYIYILYIYNIYIYNIYIIYIYNTYIYIHTYNI
jgi:hypothetical protein